jgi:hypothetical protein
MRRDWRGFWLGQVLALGLLAGCLAWVARELEFIFSNHRILVALRIQDQLGSSLGLRIAGFLGAAWLLHALFGALAFGLARLTESALPARIAGRYLLVAGWFVLLTGLAMAANVTWFPASLFASEESWWRQPLAGVPPVIFAFACVAMLVLVLFICARPRWPLSRRASLAALGAATVAALLFVLPGRWSVEAAANPARHPHIVIIGIDSLRDDLTVPRHGDAELPNIRAFLDESRRFSDATTPLARTYPSWVSILTGRHPVTTNARYNLMPRRLVHEGETLPEALRKSGYRTTYATDEVRFANIDESFGFDRLITPPIGGSDFLLGYAGDIPLVNLVASAPFAGGLFPANHANRAAFVSYRPAQYLRRLERELAVDGAAFMTIHLTLAHWPYAWAGMPLPSVPEEYRKSYALAVEEVDRQFGAVMRILETKGVLDNAIVVLLSDHGEALGADNDSMLRKTGTGDEIWNSLWGHGTSVMSPNQYQVLLALRAFGRAKLPGPKQDYDWPVSLEDLRPTLEAYATGRNPEDVDGLSLLPYMAEPARAEALAGRVRFTETDFNTPSSLAGRYEASGLIDEAGVYYELEPASGWVQLREARLPGLITRKQRAAISRDRLLASIPGPPGQGPKFLLTDRREPLPKALDGPPDAATDPATRRLWDAATARFAGEWQSIAEPP